MGEVSHFLSHTFLFNPIIRIYSWLLTSFLFDLNSAIFIFLIFFFDNLDSTSQYAHNTVPNNQYYFYLDNFISIIICQVINYGPLLVTSHPGNKIVERSKDEVNNARLCIY